MLKNTKNEKMLLVIFQLGLSIKMRYILRHIRRHGLMWGVLIHWRRQRDIMGVIARRETTKQSRGS